MKKLLLNAIAIVLIGMIVLVSCSVETNKIEDELKVVSFSVDEGNTRSLTKTNPVLNAEDFWWSYTSEKTDGTELVTGQTGADIANKKNIGTKGLTEKAGIFSYGGWKFTLYGYADKDRKELAYKGSADVVINAATTTLSVTVQSQTAGEASGKLQIPVKGAITLKLNDSDTNPTSVGDYTKLTEKVYIEGSEEGNKTFTKTEYITNTEGVTDIELASGSYKVTITYQSKEDPAEDDEDKTAPVIYAEDVIYVTIADYLTTRIGGDISENNGQVEFIAQGEIIKAKVEKTVEAGKATVLEVKAAPVSAAADTTPKTTVSIPSGVLETGKSASLSVTSFSTTAIDDGDAEDAEFTVVDTADKDKPILGALDITLTVGTEEKKDFKDSPLTITTVIAKGLNGNKDYPTEGDNTACSIQVKYNGEGDGGTVTSYNAETGELTFTVTHLSTYYVVDDNIKVYNLTQDLMYGKLEDAVRAAENGDTIRLLNSVEADKIEIKKDNLVIDLNEKSITLKQSAEICIGDDESSCDVIIKNGSIKGTADGNNALKVNNGTLTLETVTVKDVARAGIVIGSVNDVMYGKLEDAIAKADNDDTIHLLKDVNLSSDSENSVDVKKKLTVELNSKTLTLKNDCFNIESEVTFKGGTITGEGEGNGFNVKDGTLVLENITATGVTLYGIVTESSDTLMKITPPKVGDTITMGTMPSGVLNYESYVGQPITWKVLEVQNDKVLVISEKLLDSKAHTLQNESYQWTSYAKNNWSDINIWLNDTTESGFVALYGLSSVSMVEVSHKTEKGQAQQVERNSSEKVFLLSKTEVEKYFKDNTARIANLFGGEASPWYLRTPVNTTKGNSYCYYVDSNGSFQEAAAYSEIRIRPAFWISIATSLN